MKKLVVVLLCVLLLFSLAFYAIPWRDIFLYENQAAVLHCKADSMVITLIDSTNALVECGVTGHPRR